MFDNSKSMGEPDIEAFLSQKIGLNPTAIGARVISKAIDRRMKATAARDSRQYFRCLQTSPRELSALIEDLVVPETWFFRHRESFDFLRDFVSSHKKKRMWRVLSLPCSTGEEPYSISMTLMDAGLSASEFFIDAIDLNQAAITKAKGALYGKYSFREGYGLNRQRYFQPTPDGEMVRECVCRPVRFRCGNLLEGSCFRYNPSYDIIFCRNLLIYFSPEARSRALQVVEGLLAPQSLLFVGYAETRCFKTSGLTAYGTPRVCVYQKTTIDPPTRLENPPNPRRDLKENPTSSNIEVAKTKTLKNREPKSKSGLEDARRFADWGNFAAAIAACERYLKQNPMSASAYLLLGEVFQAQGNDDLAEHYFQKALYLDPDRYTSLVHLALLKEGRGDVATAKLLRQRIARLT